MVTVCLMSVVIYLVLQMCTVHGAQKCPDIFLRYSKDHSYCKPSNPSCRIIRAFVTDSEIATILKEHNLYRSSIATGKRNLPTAANMLQMVWDNELAAVAQQRAQQCQFSHDCPNCRRVQNFGVGQNIANEYITNSPTIPDSNWPLAVKNWFDEISLFHQEYINQFVAPPPDPTYGHFTQLVWAKSWRVGCGYVLYQEGNTYKKLYVCNYGPDGNIVRESMYKIGAVCSACPLNSCCGQSCGTAFEYPGLCKITDTRGPIYKPQGPYEFYCDFQGQPECEIYSNGDQQWLIYNTLSGNYLGIVLNGGESSKMTFKQHIIHNSISPLCLRINYRKGPNIDGQEESNTAIEKFKVVPGGNVITQQLPDFSGNAKQQFSFFDMSLSGMKEIEFSIDFSVPRGKPAQFFEIKDVSVENKPCSN